MNLYFAVQKVVLNDEALRKAKEFANAVTLTTDYRDASQNKYEKVCNDHLASKLGEEAAKMVLSRFATVEGPDYEIYHGNEKSWKADLLVNATPVAVKTQTTSAAMRYGLSWTFQNGIKRKDTLLLQPNAWVVFVEYDDTHLPYNTCFVLPPFQMKNLVLGTPKLDYLKDHKKVVYASSLPAMQVEEYKNITTNIS